jgi:hypothetical protein
VFYDCLTPYPPDTWLKAGSRQGEKIGVSREERRILGVRAGAPPVV